MKAERIVLLLIAVNIVAFFYGLYYYRTLLPRVPPHLWIFAIDSPLHALLIAAALSLALVGKKNVLLTNLAAIGSIKYGLWTMFVILFQGDYFLAPGNSPEYIFLFVAHIGQLLEGLFIAGLVGMSLPMLMVMLGWAWLNDYSDYFLGTHPLIPDEGLDTVRNVTFLISLVSVATVAYLARKQINAFSSIKEIGGLRRYLEDKLGKA